MKVFTANGSPHEIGIALGFQARFLVRKQLALYKEHWQKLTRLSWSASLVLTPPFEKMAQKYTPDAFAELAGIAIGAGVSPRELFLVNSFEEIDALSGRQKKGAEHCTTLMVIGAHMQDGRPRIAHNEDWVWFDKDFAYMARVYPKKGPSFLSITFGGLLPNYGVNEHGIAQVCDSLVATDERVGVPRLLMTRGVLGARTLEEAMRLVTNVHRSGGYNHVMMDSHGRGVNFEASAIKQVARPLQGFSVHTNFYQDQNLAKSELHMRTYSRYRCFRAQEILARQVHKAAGVVEEDLFAVLSDHQNQPESVCRHFRSGSGDYDQTIASHIIDPVRRSITVRTGNPCEYNKNTKQAATYFLDEPK